MRTFLLLALLAGLSGRATAQLQVKSLSAGWRVFEMDEVGGSPLTLGRLMKNPAAYQTYIDGIPHNGFFGGGVAIQRVPTFYLTTELSKADATAGFWKNHTLQVGLLATARLTMGGKGLSQNNFLALPGGANNFVSRWEVHTFEQKQQFVGLTAGLNRRARLFTDRLHFLTGLHVQGSVAVSHSYEQRFEFREQRVENGQVVQVETGSGSLASFQGKNYFQWQAMLPLGVEVAAYPQRLLVRLEANLGLVRSPVRRPSQTAIDAPGVGLWLTYQLK